MNTRRLATAGLALLASAGFAAGCATTTNGTAQPSTGASDTAPASGSSAAKSALVASIGQLTQVPYRYHAVSGGLSGQGAADPADKSATVSMTGTDRGNSATIDMVAVNTDFWLKLNFGNANKSMGISSDKWLHIDAARLGAGANLPVDPSGGAATASGLFSGLTNVQQVDGQHFTGSIDLTKATGVSGVSQDLLNKAGVKATSVPFTASLDSQGRLSDLKVDLSAIDPAQALEVSYSDYGTPVTVTKPDASQVAEAPDSVYRLFGH
ncbi:MAG TPA: hypothetical protein VJT31_09090 [Rugosimonospora sp.]|nr:hypothetical protein [Rugosimonospora sp.]